MISSVTCSKSGFLFQTPGPVLQDGGHGFQSAGPAGASADCFPPRTTDCGGGVIDAGAWHMRAGEEQSALSFRSMLAKTAEIDGEED